MTADCQEINRTIEYPEISRTIARKSFRLPDDRPKELQAAGRG